MVEWIDWGGHWSNIIGYDTMGTDEFGDDVLICSKRHSLAVNRTIELRLLKCMVHIAELLNI